MGPETSDTIAVGLAEIRARRRFLWLVFFSYVPVVALSGFLLESNRYEAAVAAAWLALFFIANMRVFRSRCPQCGKLFHHRAAISNPWARRCMHCALELDRR